MVAGRYRYLPAYQVAASEKTLGVARNTAKEATMTKKPNYTRVFESATEAWRGRIRRVWLVSVCSRTSQRTGTTILYSDMKNI